MQPFPLVSIDTRRHVPADPKLTRVGIGEARIDHAAGIPVRMRRAAPAPASDWDDQANIHDARRLRDQMYGNDAPVDLPLRSRSTSYVVAAALIVAFIAVCVSIFFTGVSPAMMITRNGSATAPVAAPQPVAAPADVSGTTTPAVSTAPSTVSGMTASGTSAVSDKKFVFPPAFRTTQRADSVPAQ